MSDREFEDQYVREIQKSVDLPEGWAERYEVLACLKDSPGKGTYLVKSFKEEEKWILKWAVGEEASHLLSEGQMLRELQKIEMSDICIKEIFQEKDRVWLLRNYVEGNSLAEVGEIRSFPEEEICRMGILICKSVENLHLRKPPVIHRDIKPENIILKKDGSIALIDLETARAYKEGKKEDTYFAGTRETAAPEQYGFGQSDERTDIYGIGKTLLYLKTGDYDLAALEGGRGSRRLKKVIRKCCAFDPQRRFATAKETAVGLEKCLPGAGGEGRRVKILTGLVALLGVAVLALSVQVLLLGWEMKGEQAPRSGSKNETQGSQKLLEAENKSQGEGTNRVIIRGWDVTLYDTLLGQILDSVEEKDYQLMAEQCRQLISELYEDPFLQAVEAEDTYYYTENDARWEGYDIVRSGYEQVSDDLAYHDRMLEDHLEFFDQYRYHIFAMVKGSIESTSVDKDGQVSYGPLYMYRYQGKTEELDYSLDHLLDSIIRGIELYQRENPSQ